jgi:hypothetical protein
MTTHEKALDFVCPVCGAAPREECHRIDGHTMAVPHSDRRYLVLGVNPRNRREEMKQSVERSTSRSNRVA